jgi:hypothetical protein
MVRAVMIVEMAGRPAEHVKKSLEKHVGQIGNFSYTEVHSIKVSEPREIEDSNGVYTSFAEIDFETDGLPNLANVVFDFMPSSLEIVEPAKITLSMQDATNLLNNVSGRMHRYDEIAKIAKFKIRQLNEELEKTKKGSVEKKSGTGKKKTSVKVKKSRKK